MSFTNYATGANLGVDVTTATSASPEYTVGARVNVAGGGEAIYVKAGGSNLGVGDVVLISPAGVAIGATTTNTDNVLTAAYLIGCMHVAVTADQYGWACLKGVPTGGISVAANCALGVPLYTTATAGVVDDAATNGAIFGMQLTVAATAAAATAGVLSNPVLAQGTNGA